MSVIKKLSDRVEREHNQFLRDAQRIEDRSTATVNDSAGALQSAAVDFESLVGGASTSGSGKTQSADNTSWDDDAWKSIFHDTVCYVFVSSFQENLHSLSHLLSLQSLKHKHLAWKHRLL